MNSNKCNYLAKAKMFINRNADDTDLALAKYLNYEILYILLILQFRANKDIII